MVFKVYSVWPRRDICPFGPVIYEIQRGHCVCMKKNIKLFGPWASAWIGDAVGAYKVVVKIVPHLCQWLLIRNILIILYRGDVNKYPRVLCTYILVISHVG